MLPELKNRRKTFGPKNLHSALLTFDLFSSLVLRLWYHQFFAMWNFPSFSQLSRNKKLCTLRTMIQWPRPTIGCVSFSLFFYILLFLFTKKARKFKNFKSLKTLGRALREPMDIDEEELLDGEVDDLNNDGFQSRNLYSDLLPNADKIPEVSLL